MKFTGEYADPTGLYHLRARQYDPMAGRFTRLDPQPAAPERPVETAYAYATGRPTVMIDPSGRLQHPADDADAVADGVASGSDAIDFTRTLATVAGSGGPCHLYVSDPVFLRPDITVTGSEHCAFDEVAIYGLKVCIQIKRRVLWVLTSWRDLTCSDWVGSGVSLANPRAKATTSVVATCVRGRHTYRGQSKGEYLTRGGGAIVRSDSFRRSPVSLHYLTASC